MPGLEAFLMGCILVTGVLLMLSFAVLVKKGDYSNLLRLGSAVVMAIVSAELGRSGPEPSGLQHKLSIIPLVIAISSPSPSSGARGTSCAAGATRGYDLTPATPDRLRFVAGSFKGAWLKDPDGNILHILSQ